MNGFQTPSIGHQILHHLPVHQGLAAKKIHLQIPAGTRMGDKEVQRLLAHIEGHEGPFSLVLALTGKTVGATQITGMSHMKTQGLDDVGVVFVVSRHWGIGVGGKKLVVSFQGGHIVDAGLDVLFGDIRAVWVIGQNTLTDLLRGVVGIKGNDVICHLVHQMDRAAASVQDDMISVQFVLMYHKS